MAQELVMKKNVVLLIEDDELDTISVERSLKKLDVEYELHTAYNGIEGLEILRGNESRPRLDPLPDVILLDLNMPKMNGIEFLQHLRSDERLKDIKVFVMTTSGEEADRRTAEQLGISGYLIKPLNFTNNSKRTDSMDGFVQFHMRKIFTLKNE
jgi:CheY-like chemotaxis protein